MRELDFKETIRNIDKRKLIGSIAVIFFFVTVILVFYHSLYSTIEDNIALRGETVSVESAEKFDRYITTSSSLLKLEAQMLNQMLQENTSHKEIQDYLVEETARIQDTIDSGYTGLYGYIMGQYHDGANWVPDEEYVPTKRPWYAESIKNNDLTIIPPYLDAQTNLIVTTIAIPLCDGSSVIALDISFDMIRTVTEDETPTINHPIQIILDDKGCVVAHSDSDEIGHDYGHETETLGAAIFEKTIDHTEKNSIMVYDDIKYMVYVNPIANGWSSISVIDTTKDYKVLNLSVVAAIVVLITAIMILVTVFYQSTQRDVLAHRLTSQLASAANIYISSIYIDIINDKCDVIKAPETSSELIYREAERWGAQKALTRIVNHINDNPTKQAALDFVNLCTLEERLGDNSVISQEYISLNDKWCVARFIVSDRTADGKLSHVLLMVEDIDAEKKEREKLIDMSDRAIAANEAKSAFLSNMSHEIRTPINAMLGLNEMILRECDDPDILSYSTGINTAGHTLLGIVNDILDFSKIEAGKMEIIPVDYSLASMLNDLVNMVHTRADTKGLSIEVKVNSHIPDMLHGDEIRIKQVITNILTNSVKYTEKGCITFSLDFEKLTTQSIILKVSVKDTGIGIKAEDMGKLFSKFDRIEEKRNRHIEGTGLGMAITQSLLSMMGSSLNVKSEYGHGSTFSFNIMQSVVSPEEIGDYESTYKESVAKTASYKEKFIAPDARVLVVDDTPLNLTVFVSLLKKTQVKIDTAESGIEAIKYACAQKYDVIFLDHMMPGKDGIETLHELSETPENLNPDTPVVCLTANAISGMREKYLEEGFDDYLTKPIDSTKLEETLMKYIPDEKLLLSHDDDSTEEDDSDKIPSSLYELSELDVRKASHKCGSAGVYLDILSSFCRGIDSFMAEARAYIEAGDTDNAAIKIHAIKSQVRTAGAFALGDFAEKLERAAKNGNIDLLKEESDELFDRSTAIKTGISICLNEIKQNDADLPEITPEELESVFAELKRCAEEFDFYIIDESAEKLKTYRIPADYADKVEKILQLVDNMDYEQIPDVLG